MMDVQSMEEELITDGGEDALDELPELDSSIFQSGNFGDSALYFIGKFSGTSSAAPFMQ